LFPTRKHANLTKDESPRGDTLMTSFTYTPKETARECVAYICLLDGDAGRPVLVIKGRMGYRTWIYHDGKIQMNDADAEQEAIHRFYPGDSVTITF